MTLNDLDMKMCDNGNNHLNADTRERLWFTAIFEWGNQKVCQVIFIRVLCGLKSSGAKWKKTFADYIWHTLGFELCVGEDDNLYLKFEKDEQGSKYYIYILVYADNVLFIHKNGKTV